MAAIRPGRTAWIALVLLNALLLALFFLLLQFRAERAELAQLHELGAAVYPEPLPLAEISLRDQAGEPFGLDRMRGAWNLVFFGFSNCPDMCPLTLAQLENFYRARPASAQPPLHVLFVSVDPADTPAIIGEFLADFHPDFVGLSGTPGNVNAFANQLFVNTGADGGSAHGGPEGMISHGVHIGVIDSAGGLVGLLRPPHRAADIDLALAMIFRRT